MEHFRSSWVHAFIPTLAGSRNERVSKSQRKREVALRHREVGAQLVDQLLGERGNLAKA
jgi:hypothetical protein